MAFGLGSNRLRTVRNLAGDRGLSGLGRSANRSTGAIKTLGGPWTFLTNGVYASLTTALTGANNDLTYTAVEAGPDGNAISVRYVVAGNSTALSVSVSGKDITINSATDGGGAATSTANQVKAAVLASTPAAALVNVALAGTDTGAGTIIALAKTNLTNGSDVRTVGRG